LYRFEVIADYCLNFGHFVCLSPTLGSLGAMHTFTGQHVVDFLLVTIELFSLSVTAEAL